MARQARNYLAGAVSGTALIGAAVVAFVMLVSLQTLRDWPLAGLAGGSEESSGAAVAPGANGSPDGGSVAGAAAGQGGSKAGGGTVALGADGGVTSPGSGLPAAGAPNATAPGPTSTSPSRSGDSAPQGAPGGAASSGSGKEGGGGGEPSGGGGGESSLSETVTGTVNNAVSGVDDATGGALGQTGVAKVTEEAVNGVAGPESPVGKTVDQTVEKVQGTVGGLLGGGR